MKYIAVLCSACALFYGEVSAMTIVDQGISENKISLAEVSESLEENGIKDELLNKELSVGEKSELLFYAIKNNRVDIVEFCIRSEFECCGFNQFDDCIKDRFEGTPQDLAKECGNEEIMKLLAGALENGSSKETQEQVASDEKETVE